MSVRLSDSTARRVSTKLTKDTKNTKTFVIFVNFVTLVISRRRVLFAATTPALLNREGGC